MAVPRSPLACLGLALASIAIGGCQQSSAGLADARAGDGEAAVAPAPQRPGAPTPAPAVAAQQAARDGGRPGARALSRATFDAEVHPLLQRSCAQRCHRRGKGGADGDRPALVLSGDPAGDFQVVRAMVTDTCNPGANPLLQRPTRVPHPAGAALQAAPVLASDSLAYGTLVSWIARACPTP